MRLTYDKDFRTITRFDSFDLPSFVVLTGQNGSGKTHLLNAIVAKHINVEDEPPIENIVSFNYEDFRLDDEVDFNPQSLQNEKDASWKWFVKLLLPKIRKIRGDLEDNYQIIKDECINQNTLFWDSDAPGMARYRMAVDEIFSISAKGRERNRLPGILGIIKKIPYSIDEISQENFISAYKKYTLKKDFLPTQLGSIIWDYYLRFLVNETNLFLNNKDGGSRIALTKEEFEKLHGPKPWTLINEIIASFGTMPFEITSPEGLQMMDKYRAKLINKERDNKEINMSELSSGERVLMALVVSVYKDSMDRHFPDLLLLDEIDASLHPSMISNMLNVIQDVFIKNGIRVILATHSPSTVALAPEDSVYLMERSGVNRVRKQSRSEALTTLTDGFATLDEGLRFMDQITNPGLTLITEGHNALIIEKVLEIHGLDDVSVIKGLEGMTGKNQLRTLFEFMTKVSHVNKVIFVWDCDAPNSLVESNNTYPFTIPSNSNNDLVKKGIENAFPVELFAQYTKTITLSNGTVSQLFDDTRKKDFADHVIANMTLANCSHFNSLVEEIRRIKNL